MKAPLRLTLMVLAMSYTLNMQGQGSLQLGLLPSVNLNKKLPKDWSVNFKAESRQSIYNQVFAYDFLLTDLALAVSRKTGVNSSLSAGYQVRIEDVGVKHRLMQQFTLVKRYPSFRVAHRFAADQTFSAEEDVEFRYRYRLSGEIPLSGQTLDPEEFFVKLSNEYLNAWQSGDHDLEIRLAAFLGYEFTPTSKAEIGLEQRLSSFLDGSPRHRFWLGINFFQSF